MRNKILSFLLFSFFFLTIQPAISQQVAGYMFRLTLKDKGNPPYSLDKPEEFLSMRALERRAKQGLQVDSTDLPVDPAYLSAIREKGADIRVVSKWVNTVTVYLSDSSMIELVKDLPFVDSVDWVWVRRLPSHVQLKFNNEEDSQLKSSADASYYGAGYEQIHMHNGDLLHEAGFKGDGMTIAVIDANFINVDQIDFFNPSQIIGHRNYTHYTPSETGDGVEHGTRVLSCMLANKPGMMVGTAPGANYYLIQTEVPGEEYAVEEDYWVAGIEYADSLGVDVVNSSLGYHWFYETSMNHTLDQLDGNSVPISRAATLAAKKGMLVFIAAGNEQMKEWTKISFPADAKDIITVGGVDAWKEVAQFSSLGYTSDGRVKPDLMARSNRTSVITSSNQIFSESYGTSFSSPILAGLGACLWQALPGLTNMQIMELLKKNADRFQHPDSIYGYGIPDVYQAYVSNMTGIPTIERDPAILYFHSSSNLLYINLSAEECFHGKLQVFSIVGNRILQKQSLTSPVDIGFLSKGVYIACLDVEGKRYVRKFIKN